MLLMIRALIWEVLRKNRIGLVIAIFVAPTLWKIIEYWILSSQVMSEYFPAGRISFAILSIAVLLLYFTFSYVDSHSNNKHAEGFPKHVLRLPLPTWVLAVVPIILGTVVVSGFIMLWINNFLDFQLGWLMQLTICCVAGTFIAWSQAINWGLNTPILQKIMLLLSVIAALVCSVLAILKVDDSDSVYIQLYGSLGLFLLLVSGYYFSFVTLIRTRRGESFLFFNVPQFSKLVDRLTNSKRVIKLSDGVKAQYWYEWKMLAFVIPLIIGVVSVITIVGVSFSGKLRLVPISILLTSMVFLMSSFSMAGNKLGLDKFNILPHCATRPLSDFDLAMSKLIPLAIAFAIGYVFFLFTPFICLTIVGFPEANELSNQILTKFDVSGVLSIFALSVILVMAAFWIISANGVSILLMDSKLFIFGFNTLFFCAGAFIIWGYAYIKNDPENFQALIDSSVIFQFIKHNTQLVPLLLTSLITMLMVFLLAKFKRVANILELKKYGVYCVGFLIICLSLLRIIDMPEKIFHFASYSILNVTLLCFLPFIIAPISVARNRHR